MFKTVSRQCCRDKTLKPHCEELLKVNTLVMIASNLTHANTEFVTYDHGRLTSLTLWLFTTVRGESRRAPAQQSDGDRGGHEENQGKMARWSVSRPESQALTSSSSVLRWLVWSMMEDWNLRIAQHNHTHNTKNLWLSDYIFIELIVSQAVDGQERESKAGMSFVEKKEQ